MPKTLYVDNSIITKEKKFTFLSADVNAGATAFGFASSIGLVSLTTSSGQILQFGELGQEKSEIILTSNVSTSTGSNIGGTSATLKTALRFDHSQDTKVYIIDWDRFEVQWSATATGSKSTITTTGADYPSNIQPDQGESIFRDTTQTTGYYFVRFNETIGNTNSDWSDPIPFAGFDDSSVFAIKQRALEQIGEKIDGEVISNEFLNRVLWQARREYHKSPGKRPFRRSYNVDIGNVSTGMFRVDLPPYVEAPWTAENVYGVRIGNQPNMRYIDKKEWDFYFVNKPHTTLSTAYTVGDQDLYVSNVRDFTATGGSVSIEQDTISYSAVGVSGNTLRISTAGTYNHAINSDVWQNASYGLPDRFTVFADVGGSAYIYFNRPVDTVYVNQNIYADYYRTLVDFDSDADILDEPHPDIFVPYLSFKIKQRKNLGGIAVTRNRQGGAPIIADADYQEWQARKQEALAKEYLGVEVRLIPDLDRLL